MDTINWLHIRGLALLALLGMFYIYALLFAYWHDWQIKRRARRIGRPTKAARNLYTFFTSADADQSKT